MLETYTRFLSTIPDAALVVDESGTIIAVNHHAEVLFGYGDNELEGLSIHALIPDNMRDRHEELSRRFFDNPRTRSMGTGIKLNGKLRDGGTVPVDIMLSAIELDGQSCALCVVRDITERRAVQDETELQLRQQTVVAEIGHEALRGSGIDQLLSTIAHKTTQALGMEYCLVLENSPDHKTFTIKTACGFGENFTGKTLPNTADSVAGYTLLANEPVIINDLDSDDRFGPGTGPGMDKARSGASILIPNDDFAWGVICLFTAEQRNISHNETVFLQSLAVIAAEAIKRARIEEEVRRKERDLRRSQERLVEAQSVAHIGSWELDLRTNGLYWSDEVYRIFELEQEGFIPSYESFLNVIHPDDRDLVNNTYLDSVKNGKPYEVDHRLLMPDGRVKHVYERGLTHYGADGVPLRSVGTVQDITERKLAEEALNRVAYEDHMTGLLSREGFIVRLQSRLEDIKQGSQSGYVVVLDISNLYDINQAYGYDAGDTLLKDVAARINETFGETAAAGRVGGDQFALILDTTIPEPDDAAPIATSVNGLFEERFLIADQYVEIEAYLGIVPLTDQSPAASDVLRRAHLALNSAREQYAVNWTVYNPVLDNEVFQRIRITTELKSAIRNQEFELHYQPKVNLADGTIVSAEALLRWRHPENGLWFPDRFIPVAERSQLIIPIGEWILLEACRQLLQWRKSSLAAVNVSVNVSMAQFTHSNFIKTVEQALAETGVSAGSLTVEITESMFELQTAELLDQILQLRELGVRLSLDDFGTGYSSLSHLHAYPFDEVKIDKSFVKECVTNKYSREIVRMIIRLGEVIDSTVVAEGIEDPQHRDLLMDLGCTVGQGFYYSRPLEKEEFQRLLESRKPLPL